QLGLAGELADKRTIGRLHLSAAHHDFIAETKTGDPTVHRIARFEAPCKSDIHIRRTKSHIATIQLSPAFGPRRGKQIHNTVDRSKVDKVRVSPAFRAHHRERVS